MPRLIFDEKELIEAVGKYQRVTPVPQFYEGLQNWSGFPKPLLELPDTAPAIEFIRRLGWEDRVLLIDNWNYPPIKVLKVPNYTYPVN